jgi:hypothetical protein
MASNELILYQEQAISGGGDLKTPIKIMNDEGNITKIIVNKKQKYQQNYESYFKFFIPALEPTRLPNSFIFLKIFCLFKYNMDSFTQINKYFVSIMIDNSGVFTAKIEAEKGGLRFITEPSTAIPSIIKTEDGTYYLHLNFAYTGYSNVEVFYEELYTNFYFDKDIDTENMFINRSSAFPNTTTILTTMPAYTNEIRLYPVNSVLLKSNPSPNTDNTCPFYRTNTTWQSITVDTRAGWLRTA